MKIVNTPPPNYEEIKKHFPDAKFKNGVLFTYGDTCHCKRITPDLIVHERTHSEQQLNPEEWWKKYFKDPKFRLSQEIEAYKNQYKYINKTIKDRNKKARLLHEIASTLSGKLYGNIISYNDAISAVKNEK